MNPPTMCVPWRQSRRLAMALLLALFAAGALLIWWSVARADGELRSELLRQTQLVTAALNVTNLKALTGTGADVNRPEYQRLTAQLQSVCATNPNWRWLYLMGRGRAPGVATGQPPPASAPAGAAIFFYLDSEPASSKDHEPPGKTYLEAPASFYRVFDTGQPATEGPYTDHWGKWISVLVPLTDPHSGAVLAVLGVDIDASDWKWAVADRAALPVVPILLLLIGAATLFIANRRIATTPKPVLRQLLPPLTAMVCLLLAGASLLLYRQHRQQLADEITDQVADTANDLRTAMDQQASCLAVAAQFIATTPGVQQALRTGDADHLLTAWQPRFEMLRQQHVLTHFYFFTANRTCLLRLHHLEKRGDRITRATALASERTGRTAIGIELGPMGLLTLRAVQPVVADGQHVGYVELGREIGDSLKQLRENRKLELAVIIRKDYLTRAAWEDSRRLLSQDADWDRLPHNVVSYASLGRLPDAMAAWADPATGISCRHETNREIVCEGKTWRVAAMPLLDTAGQMVGELLILRDVSPEIAAFARLLTMGAAGATALMSLLLGFLYILLRRTDAGIQAQQVTLRDSEARYDHLAAQSGTVTWEVNPQGLYTYVSHISETVFGFRPDELVGRLHCYDLHPEAGREAFKTATLAVAAQRANFQDLINPVQTKDGHLIWVSTTGIPLLNADGTLRGYSGSDTDITQRWQTEQHREQQLRFTQALNEIAEVTLVKNEAKDILEAANRLVGETLHLDRSLIYDISFDHQRITSLCEWLGSEHPDITPTHGRYSALEMFLAPLTEIRDTKRHLESHAGAVNDLFRRNRAGEELLHDKLRIKSLLWYPFAFDAHGYYLFTLNQILAPRHWTPEELGFMESVTRQVSLAVMKIHLLAERQRTEAERERLAMAVEQAAEIVVITDPSGTIEYVNPQFTTVTGYPHAEAVGHNMRLLKSGQQDAAFYRDLWNTIANGKTWQGRFVNRKKNGTLYTEDATISPVHDAIGAITCYVALKRDISEHLGLHAQLTQAQKMESVGRLAGGVAHDFNNILQAILGSAELAVEQTLPTDQIRRDLDEIQSAARRAADLTRQLLAFARKQVVTPRILDVNATVEGVLKMLRRLIGENIDLVWIPGAELWPVKMDPGQLDQILANLCVNARDAIAGVGAIHIETKNTQVDELNAARYDGFLPGDYVVLTICDTGCGMDETTQRNIFEPFFTTKATGKGTGLGLATVYGIVRQNQGRISVYSEPGQGTSFRIHLPRHRGADTAPYAAGPTPPAARGCETVLVVEDDLPLLNLGSRILRSLGYTVLMANAPADALRLAEEHPGKIHLLLTDVIMPGMNGRDLADQLTARLPQLKCLFMSGFTADVIARQGILDLGVQFIQKPFSAADLAAKIRETLDSAKDTT